MDSNNIYVVPDVHGRSFWHDVEKLEGYEKIVFLGDYVDPYPDEGVKQEEGMKCLMEVIDFAKSHDNVILLLGNHDATYMLGPSICECRTDYVYFEEIRDLFRKNADMFDLAYCAETENGPVLFTHAGLFKDWLEDEEVGIDAGQSPDWIADGLNQIFHDLAYRVSIGENVRDDGFFNKLGAVSFYRGGWGAHGSCVWSDIREHYTDEDSLDSAFQVVGHTRLERIGSLIKFGNIACIDSKQIWRLKDVFDADSTMP